MNTPETILTDEVTFVKGEDVSFTAGSTVLICHGKYFYKTGKSHVVIPFPYCRTDSKIQFSMELNEEQPGVKIWKRQK